MATLDTVDITKLLLVEQGSTPANPAAGKQKLFIRSSDHLLCTVDSSGTVTPWGGALTNPMTTPGDIIVGGASGAPTRLAKGAAGGVLAMYNGTVTWDAGTSFPVSPATGDRYWRTDLGRGAYYDGTRWLSTEIYHLPIGQVTGGNPGDALGGTNNAAYRSAVWNDVYDIWLVSFYSMTYVASGNTGSAYWTVTLYKETQGAAYATASLGSFSTGTGPDTSAQFTPHTVAIGALMGTGYGTLVVGGAKTSTPGNLTSQHAVTYRVVYT